MQTLAQFDWLINILAKARSAIEAQQGRNLVLGPGCSVQVANTSHENLLALRQAVESA